MSEELKWGWMASGSEEANGEFDTKEEALKDAKEHFEDKGTEGEIKIEVGRCVYPDPTDFIDDDLDDMLERMDQRACDTAYGFWDDEIFDVIDHEAAQKDLIEVLQVWAKKHIITAPCWVLDCTENMVVICEQEKAK